MAFRKGRWVKLRRDLVKDDVVLEKVGAVGITNGYRTLPNGGPTLLEMHLVDFPKGETRAITYLPDTWVELVMTKAELPPDRVAHLPDDWTPQV